MQSSANNFSQPELNIQFERLLLHNILYFEGEIKERQQKKYLLSKNKTESAITKHSLIIEVNSAHRTSLALNAIQRLQKLKFYILYMIFILFQLNFIDAYKI